MQCMLHPCMSSAGASDPTGACQGVLGTIWPCSLRQGTVTMRIAYNSVAREGKGREAALASGVHALHLPVPVPRAAAPLPANTPAGSNPRAASYIYIYIYIYIYPCSHARRPHASTSS